MKLTAISIQAQTMDFYKNDDEKKIYRYILKKMIQNYLDSSLHSFLFVEKNPFSLYEKKIMKYLTHISLPLQASSFMEKNA